MSDLENILSGENSTPEEPQETAEQPEEPTKEAEGEQPEAVEEPEQPEKPDDSPTVPLPVFTTTRDDLKAQLRAANEKLAQYEQRQQQPEQDIPDVLDDQKGFVTSIQQQVSRATMNAKLDVSETMARDAYGDELVDEALEAAKSAGYRPDLQKERHPWGALVKWHQGQKAIQEIGDPATYKERLAAEVRKEIEAEMAANQAKEMAGKSPPSMANVNGSGGQRDPGWQGPTSLTSLIGD